MLQTAVVAALLALPAALYAQDGPRRHTSENYGNTLNIGLGIAYFGDLRSAPIVLADYELNVARNFTIAPFIGFSSYRSQGFYYSGDYYYYHETVIPVGAKATYYFDELLELNPRWDLYLAASLGFTYDHIAWDNGYYGDKGVASGTSSLYLDGHIGAEYHFSKYTGVFLDLSTYVSTVGLAFHSKRH
jgi:hypothetical protein